MTLENAHAFYRNGDFTRAEAILVDLRNSASTDSTIFHLSALVSLRLQRPHQALNYIKIALKNSQRTEEVLNTLGRIYQALGEDLYAETAFRKALEVSPHFKLARTNLVNHLIDIGDPEKSEIEFEYLLNLSPSDINYSAALSASLLEMNRYEDAFQALSNYGNDNSKASIYRAKALFQKGDFDAAIAHNSIAYKDPKHAAQALQLSLQIAAMTGTWDGVSSHLIQELISQHPQADDVWAIAITALYKYGETGKAQDLFQSAPMGPAVIAAHVDALNLNGDFKQAEEFIVKALTQTPGYPSGLAQYCLSLLGLGKYDDAQSVADIALRSLPNNQFYYAIKATAGRKKGQDYGYYFNYEKFVRPYTLPTPKGWKTLASFNQQLAEELDSLHNFQNAPLNQTLRGGTQTNPNLKFVNHPAIASFFETVKAPIADYLSSIGASREHPFLRRNSGRFRIRSGWSVRLSAGGHHVNHVHPEGWISSSYYVDVPKANGREGNIIFGRPPIDMGLDEEHEIQPKSGELVLFPSYLWHGTVPFSGTESRLTLPIDIMPA